MIQTPSEACLIIPPYAVAVNISEAMPLVAETVSSAVSVYFTFKTHINTTTVAQGAVQTNTTKNIKR